MPPVLLCVVNKTCSCVVNMVTGGGTVSPAGVAGPGVIAGSVTGCMSTSTPTPGADTAGLPPQRRTSENRRVSLFTRGISVRMWHGSCFQHIRREHFIYIAFICKYFNNKCEGDT